jgi:tRNA wybutosine-synthesizing protein 1
MLKYVKFTVFGLGNSLYDENYCKASMTLLEYMESLGAQPFHALGKGDDQVDQQAHFDEWKTAMLPALCEQYALIAGVAPAPQDAVKNLAGGCCSTGVDDATAGTLKQTQSWENAEPKVWLSAKEHRRQKRKAREAKEKAEAIANKKESKYLMNEEDLLNMKYLAEESDSDDDDVDGTPSEEAVVDMEDLGPIMLSDKKKKKAEALGAPKEMVTPMQRRALTKEGYKIIGTHSAVKLCRWTKHQLRGRGGCYKHTFYGITSYQVQGTRYKVQGQVQVYR